MASSALSARRSARDATTRRTSTLARQERRHALAFMSPALVGLTLFTAVPVVLSVVMSLFAWPTFGERKFVGLGNYSQLFADNPDFWPALRNSVVFTVLYVPLNLVIALGLALALGPRIRGRGALRVLFFIPVVTPIVANVLVWKMLLQPRGLVSGAAASVFGLDLPNFLADRHWAMIMVVVMSVWQGMGYNMLVLSAATEQLPASVIEAAKVDGAGGARLLGSVIIPMLAPAIFFCVVMTTITSLQVFAQPQLLTGGGPGNATMPLVMFIFTQGFKFQQLGLAAAAAWVLFAFILGLTALQFRAQRRWVHYEH